MPSGITSGTLVTSAMRLVGAISVAETPSANEMVDGLSCLNDLLELWSTSNLAMYGSAVEVFPTVAAQAIYTIGPTGNWNTTRPVRIAGDAYCTFNGVDFPVDIIGQDEYDAIALKTQQQPIVEKLLYVNANPLGLITLWPVPSGVVNIGLNTDRVLSSIPDAFTVMSFPPGYLINMKYQLAILYGTEFGIPIPPEISGPASTMFASLKRANRVRRKSTFDGALINSDPVIWQTGV